MKFAKPLKALLAFSAFALQGAVFAAPILDQNNPDPTGGFCYLNGCAQSFQQSAATIAGAGIYINQDYRASAADVTIGIYDALTGGNLIASGIVRGVSSQSGWIDAFWSPVAVTAGSQYFLRLSATSGDLVASYSDGAYAGGTAWYAANQWPGYDLAFRTYADDGAGAVPEPASLALLGLGLFGVAASRRRKG